LLRLTNKQRARTKIGRKLRPFTVIVNGREKIPKRGPAIVAGNHLSYGDPVILSGAADRNNVFMAAAELWRNPIFAPLLIVLRHIPVKRGNDASHQKAKDKFLRHLGAGGLAILYPEGKISRNGDGTLPPLLKLKRGVYDFARETGAPVVPVGITGVHRLLRPGSLKINRKEKVTLNFGEPFYVEEDMGAEEFLTLLRWKLIRLSGQELAEA
jgi:1-acyl-sn-glycerol-3-phosphate acyltransferase